MSLEAAAALTRLKDHPEKLKKAAGEDPSAIVYAVERAEAEIAWEAKVAELREVAKGRKWKTVDEPRDEWAKRSFKTLARWGYRDRELDLDVRKHQTEPCHAVMIPKHKTFHNATPSATSVCTDPARHAAKGASLLKVKAPAAAPKRQASAEEVKLAQERLDRKAAAGARSAVLARALAEYTPKGPTSPELRMTLQAGVRRTLGWDTAELACELLGLKPEGKESSDTYGALDRYAGELVPLQLHRCALALAFACLEVELRGSYGRFSDKGVAEHYAYLAELGYQLSPYEQEKLAEAAEKAGADRAE
jgi:hypothetical protein